MDEFIGLGQVEKRDPGAHPSDPRGTVREHSNGLTKREYFAGLAMQGILSNSKTVNGEGVSALLIEESLLLADALIVELNKEKK